MFYFIPSWYKKEVAPWNSAVKPWYNSSQRLEFDDTVAQVQMFANQGEPLKIITLNYDPKQRLFLRSRNLEAIECANIFDEIQGVDANFNAATLDYKRFDWPQDCDFVLGTFRTAVYLHQKLYAYIDYDETSRISSIKLIAENGQVKLEYLFDCRGFLSSLTNYQTNRRKLFAPDGRWVIEIDMKTTEVFVNDVFKDRFEQAYYPQLEELVCERLRYKLVALGKNDVLVASASDQNLRVIGKMAFSAKLIYSFFKQRTSFDDTNIVRLKKAQLLVVDRLSEQQRLAQLLPEFKDKIKFMPPYDTTLRLGHSQRYKNLKLYLNIDSLNDANLRHAITQIVKLMLQNQLVTLTLGSINSEMQIASRLDDLVKAILKEQNVPKDRIIYRMSEQVADKNEFDLNDKPTAQAIDVVALKTRQDLFNTLDSMRVVLDLGKRPANYLALAALSAAVPQINTVQTAYVVANQNGTIIADISELKQAVLPYVTNLSYWNKAMMAAVNQISRYAGENIVADWKELVGVVDE